MNEAEPQGQREGGSRTTFIELVVALVAAGLFVALFVVASAKARVSAKRANCMSNLKYFGLALNMYAQDNNDGFPTRVPYNVSGKTLTRLSPGDGLSGLGLLVKKGYITDSSLYSCPTGRPAVKPDDPARGIKTVGCTADNCSYGYDPRHKTTHPADVAVMADRSDAFESTGNSPNHARGGQMVLYIDGHVTWFSRTTVGHKNNGIYTSSDDAATTDYESVSHIVQ